MSFLGNVVGDVANGLGDVLGDVGHVAKIVAPEVLGIAGGMIGGPIGAGIGSAIGEAIHGGNLKQDVTAGLLGGGGAEIGSLLSGAGSAGSALGNTSDGVAIGTSVVYPPVEETGGGLLGEDAINEFGGTAKTAIQQFMSGNVGGDSFTNSVGSGLDNLEVGATNSTESFLGSLGQDFSSLFGNGFSGFLSDVGNISTDVVGLINKFSTDLDTFLKPITSLIVSIDNIAEALEDKLILPITNIITTTMSTANGLITGVQNDLKDGLAGIVQIPGTIASALTTEGSALLAANQELGGTQHGIVVNDLVPGLTTGLGGQFKEAIGQLIPQPNYPTQGFQGVHEGPLSTPTGLDSIRAMFDKIGNNIDQLPWFMKWLPVLANGLIEPLAGILGALDSWKSIGQQAVRMDNPIEPLAIDAAVRGARIGAISMEAMQDELLRQGLDGTRAAAMYSLTDWIWPPTEALRIFRRDLISQSQYEAEAAKSGMTTEQAQILQVGTDFLYPPEDVQALFARGVISQENRDAVLKAQAFQQADIDALPDLELELPSPVSAINAYRRELGGEIGLLQGAFSVPMPASVADIYAQRQIDPRQAQFDWINHWDLPSTRDWFLLYKRGVISEGDYHQALTSKAVPLLLQPSLDTLFRAYPPFWYLKEILATGKVPQATGLEWLVAQGFTDGDAALIYSASAPAVADINPDIAQSLAKVTASTGKDLYQAGTITAAEYTQILSVLGYGTETITLDIELANITIQATARTALVDTLKAQAENGEVTVQDAATAMYNAGFTTTEVNQAVASIGDAITKKIKLPSEAELGSMVKKGVIDLHTYIATLQQIGYSKTWAGRLADIL